MRNLVNLSSQKMEKVISCPSGNVSKSKIIQNNLGMSVYHLERLMRKLSVQR